jgi:predicted amidohydrolase
MPAPLSAHVAAASLNQTVGDWAGNTKRIREVIAAARARGAKLLVLPEMCIPGYSLGDRLMMRGTLERSLARASRSILPDTRGLVVLLGLPLRHRDVLYNAVAVCADGRVCGAWSRRRTSPRATCSTRTAGSAAGPAVTVEFTTVLGHEVPIGAQVFEPPGLGRFGVEICEDGWKGIRPGSRSTRSRRAHGGQPVRELVHAWQTPRPPQRWSSRSAARTTSCTCTPACSAATRPAWCSTAACSSPRTARSSRRDDRFVFDAEFGARRSGGRPRGLERARMEEGSWRQQVEALQRGDLGQRAHVSPRSRATTPPRARPPRCRRTGWRGARCARRTRRSCTSRSAA